MWTVYLACHRRNGQLDMHSTYRILSHSLPPSKQVWLRRQGSDPYVRQRLSQSTKYRSRSAFKLIQLHNKWGRFLEPPDVKNVVDLGAAPGGWSQVIAGKLGWLRDDSSQMANKNKRGASLQETGFKSPTMQRIEDQLDRGFWSDNLNEPTISHSHLVGRGKIIAVDLLPIEPIHGVNILRADFLSDRTSTAIQALLTSKDDPEGKADIILSDVAANMSGIGIRDSQSSLDICNAVIQFTLKNLRRASDIGRSEGGVLVYVPQGQVVQCTHCFGAA